MTQPTLDTILEETRQRLPLLRECREQFEEAAAHRPSPSSFRRALLGPTLGLIAEIKRRSPSAGRIADLDPVTHARAYADGGASAISVLTNEPFFGGSLADLTQVSRAVPTPLLRKDFILDEIQILEARSAGAAAVLLIVRALSGGLLARLIEKTREIGLEPLVEVHTETEITMALEAGADILGVNSRDLHTFTIDTPRAWSLFPLIPAHCVAIAESGMSTVGDVTVAAVAGADAVLVGTALSRLADPGALVRQIRQVVRRGR
ncbi:MAG: indole-3-glycerol phosphate synthase TrpC [Gemmatimonadota bacterium]